MSISVPPKYRLRVKQRLHVVAYAQTHGMKPAGRHFGLDRKTVRDWVQRWKAGGDAGLAPRYPKRRKPRVPPETVELIRNYERFSLALDGRTPGEKLRHKQEVAAERVALAALLAQRASTPPATN